MAEAFIIMRIGDGALDKVYQDVISPAMVAAGLTPRRVDQHNAGGLLHNEIAAFIERASVIVADLTDERPNCYLEVGYALGLGKSASLILCARQDHQPDGARHVPGGPKVHFDLGGYDVLYWDPDDLARYRHDLEARIRRRLAILSSVPATGPWDESWLSAMRDRAQRELNRDV